MISVLLTIFNKENLIEHVLRSIHKTQSSLVKQWVIVFDGCTDKSEEITRNYIEGNNVDFQVDYVHTPDVFEIRANNAGLKIVNQEYVIIIQDDMVIYEMNFDKRLLQPFLKINNLLGVTGRTAHNVEDDGNGGARWTDAIEGPVGHNRGKPTNVRRDRIYLRLLVNRGPLMLNMEKVRILNYFSEDYQKNGCDDHDLSIRGFDKFGWRVGSFWIDYASDLDWGSTRNGPNAEVISKTLLANEHLLISKHKMVIENYNYNKEILDQEVIVE